jgi:hypothetical protein
MTHFLSEIKLNIDGGPGCMRDDCMHNFSPAIHNVETDIVRQDIRCLSCGKSWTEEYKKGDDIRIS